MKAALILNGTDKVPVWQQRALANAIAGGLEIRQVLHCVNGSRRSVHARHTLYYLFAYLTRRRINQLRPVSILNVLPVDVERILFECENEGSWQRIPKETADRLGSCEVAIKFGMGLLIDPASLPMPFGVLSYHHGDPRAYRGRPAGFYELAGSESVLGIIVQQLSNTLDGGQVLAQGYSRVNPSSYSRTLDDAYRTGIPLLAQAISALRFGRPAPVPHLGPNRTLPTNSQVARTSLRLTWARLRHFTYGAFGEKRWRVARMSAPLCTEGEVSLDLTHAHTIPIPAGHTFTADPAGVLDGRVYCEVMSRRDGIGSIAAYSSQGWQRVEIPVGDRHLSFPQLVRHEAKTYLFPEMAQVGPPMLFRLEASGLATDLGQPLKGLEGLRLLDGTLLEHRDHWYLFASQADELDSRLDLWQSPSLHGRWTLHPQSPVCLDPRRARMAGPLIREGGSLFRVGQDGATAYGSGAVVHRIVELTPESFSEVVVARVSVAGACGPHTLLVDDGGFWFDYYRDAWTPMAGVRRVRARLRPR